MNSKNSCSTELDKEWIQLMMEARNLGMQISTIKEFFNENKINEALVKK